MTWIEELPKKLSSSLHSLLEKTEKHEETYMKAESASVGQMWVAMAQMNQRLDKMEDMLQAQRKAMKEQGVDVDNHLDRNLEESLKRY
jgi:hypothetical protein